MYEFLDRLIYIALPRVRDFKGLSKKSFDGNGNYSIGIKEQIIFPEINYDKIDKIRGMDISIVTNTYKEDHAYELLKGFNLPFKKLKGGLMSKLSLIERNKKRIKLYKKYKDKHDKLLKQANNKKLSPEEQFQARLKLSKIPRNASKVRIRNRCALTGRARGVYRKFKLSRIAFRELASIGHVPGITKSSW